MEAKLYIGDYAVYDLSLTSHADGPAKAELHYLHRDRLGSVVAMSRCQGAVINMSGRGFDAFGKPREEGWQDSDHSNGTNEPGDLNRNDLSTRGFTGHEHLNETDLIHMNGRVYDYNLGRFLSVDPFIQFPANSQGMNAYSYIMNNPLSGIDPSGYQTQPPDATMSGTGASSGGNSAVDYSLRKVAPTGSHIASNSRVTTQAGTAEFDQSGNILSGSGDIGSVYDAILSHPGNGASTAPTTNMGTGSSNGTGAAGQPANYVEVMGAQGSSGNGMMNSAMAQMNATGCQVPLRCGDAENRNSVAQKEQQGVDYYHIDEPGIEPSYLIEGVVLWPWRATVGLFRGAGALIGLGKGAVALADDALRVGGFTYTKTAAGHLATRLYMNSPSVVNEIMATGRSIADPGGVAGALRFDVAGSFNGSKGAWELVVHPETKTIYHFLFKSTK